MSRPMTTRINTSRLLESHTPGSHLRRPGHLAAPLFSMAIALALLAIALATRPAGATTLNLDTGAAGSAWTVTQISGNDNGPGLNTTSTPVILLGTLPFAANLPGFEAFAWANPFGGALWVGQRTTDGQFSNGGSISCGSPCGAAPGVHEYSYVFDASLGGSLTIDGFTADNQVLSLSVIQDNNGTQYSCDQKAARLFFL